jgi:MFS family permease
MNKPLWTHDFTIITLGTVISMFGNALTGFAASLMVLDYTESAFLYSLCLAVYTVPQILMPLISGAVLDRFSRKRMIYTLDFTSAVLYGLAALLVSKGMLSPALLAVYLFLIGSISSIYTVAYDSFYPLLVAKENYQRAYSIASILETISAVMVPVAALMYNAMGIVPIFLIDACTFFAAAVMETQIRTEEQYIETQKETRTEARYGKQVLIDMKEGMQYLKSEKGLWNITLYFTATAIVDGCSTALTLPYFRSTYANGEYIYMIVWGMALVGRALGGTVHYHRSMNKDKKYDAALMVYIVTNLIGAFYLFTPVPVMTVLCFCSGVMGITSYTIRVSGTQSYVPDEKKGRFNGAFHMLNTAGALAGEVSGGALSEVLPVRLVLMVYMLACTLAAVLFIGRHRAEVSAIYNR